MNNTCQYYFKLVHSCCDTAASSLKFYATAKIYLSIPFPAWFTKKGVETLQFGCLVYPLCNPRIRYSQVIYFRAHTWAGWFEVSIGILPVAPSSLGLILSNGHWTAIFQSVILWSKLFKSSQSSYRCLSFVVNVILQNI